jgi:hypothetical protein
MEFAPTTLKNDNNSATFGLALNPDLPQNHPTNPAKTVTVTVK